METWTTVVIALIVAISALSGTFIQNRYSNKRFKRERRREVWGEALLELRTELAVMATKLEKLAKQGKSFTVPNKTKEQEEEALKEAINDWNNYVSNDHLEKVLYSQFDAEIVNRVKEIRNEYLDTYDTVVTYGKELSSTEFGKAARAAEEKIRPKVVEVQSLINEQLEEL